MMQLYFGVLNKNNALDLYDPSLTIKLQSGTTNTNLTTNQNPLDHLQPTSTAAQRDLDERTSVGREKLDEALFERYYK